MLGRHIENIRERCVPAVPYQKQTPLKSQSRSSLMLTSWGALTICPSESILTDIEQSLPCVVFIYCILSPLYVGANARTLTWMVALLRLPSIAYSLIASSVLTTYYVGCKRLRGWSPYIAVREVFTRLPKKFPRHWSHGDVANRSGIAKNIDDSFRECLISEYSAINDTHPSDEILVSQKPRGAQTFIHQNFMNK